MSGMHSWILRQMADFDQQKLADMSESELKALWDQYDGCNAPSGYSGEDIHLALNLKGCGDYCRI